jgi:AmmeMemoRadiSam system protein A
LLRIARLSIEAKLENKNFVPDYTELSDDCFERAGLFVVLIQDNMLKSIAGVTEGNKEIYVSAQECAVNAALYNSKYKKVAKNDLPNIVIEMSILSDMKKLTYNGPDDLKSKINSRMGLMLKEGMHKQVFLPTMWRMYPDKEDFLDHLCFEAGLQEASWRRTPLNLYHFTAETFAEDDAKDDKWS